MLGGRLGYVLFYKPDYFLENPLADLRAVARRHVVPWRAGSASSSPCCSSRAKREHPVPGACRPRRGGGADRAVPRPPRQFRQWRAVRPADRRALGDDLPGRRPGCRAIPSQLYEAALEGWCCSCCCSCSPTTCQARRWPGVISGVFLAGYGIARILVEFFREPDAQLGFLSGGATMGQLLSLPMIAVGIVLWCARVQRGAARRHERARRARSPRRIRATGPLSLADFMADALTHPTLGYYRRGDPLGRGGRFHHRAGDQPDVRRADRAVAGRWLGARWAAPSPSCWSSSGPGAARLMADALRAGERPAGVRRDGDRPASGRDRARPARAPSRRPSPPRSRHVARRRSRPCRRGPAARRRQRVLRRAADPPVRAQPRRLARAHGRRSTTAASASAGRSAPPSAAATRCIAPAQRDAPIGAIAEVSPAARGAGRRARRAAGARTAARR